jgi:hypothetical protein
MGGAHFDPKCAEAFCALQPKLRELLAQRARQFATVADVPLPPLPSETPAPPDRRVRTVAIPKKAWTDYLNRMTGKAVENPASEEESEATR